MLIQADKLLSDISNLGPGQEPSFLGKLALELPGEITANFSPTPLGRNLPKALTKLAPSGSYLFPYHLGQCVKTLRKPIYFTMVE